MLYSVELLDWPFKKGYSSAILLNLFFATGYLAEENCYQAYQSFLHESVHLKGIRHAFLQGKENKVTILVAT